MSALGTVLSPSLGLALASDIGAVLFAPKRGFGSIIPDVVVEEQSEDTLQITEHPVEVGAAITDHVYKRPAEVTVRCLWSDSSINGLVDDPLGALLGGHSSAVYAMMLTLQASAVPFTLYTGKRVYPSMLIQSLGVETRAETENSLAVVARCRQIIVVQTQSTTLPPASQQAKPQQTATPADAGTQQPTAVQPNESVLSSIWGGSSSKALGL